MFFSYNFKGFHKLVWNFEGKLRMLINVVSFVKVQSE